LIDTNHGETAPKFDGTYLATIRADSYT